MSSLLKNSGGIFFEKEDARTVVVCLFFERKSPLQGKNGV
jgi:hypothetical protein